jgi:class 3 adenylate cyclase
MSVLSFLKKPSRVGILLGLLCAVAAEAVAQLAPFRGLEEWVQDAAFAFRGKRTTRARVILIGLDDQSLDDVKKPLVYTSPEIATVVAFTKAQGATAIGLDIIVPESLKSLPELEADGVGDATKLGALIQDAGNVVLSEWKLEDRWLLPLPQWRLKALMEPGPTDSGFVNLTEDDDHYVRRQQLLIPDGGQGRMQFALALFAKAQHIKEVKWEEADQTLRLDGERIPLDDEQKFRINFAGPPGTFPVMPLREALAAASGGKKMPEFSGSIVIIGVTARSQQDYHATPFANNFGRSFYSSSSGLMSGTEIHAHVIATLQDRAYIVAPPWAASFAVLLVIGAVLGRVFAKWNLIWGFGIAVVHHFSWKYLCFAALAYFNWRCEIVAMLLMGMLLYSSTFMYRWWTTRHSLSVGQSENVAHYLEDDPGQLDRQGKNCHVSVLFADIRSFTNFSANHSAREVVALLNAYFTALVPVIDEYGGTLNQYMGDGVMVIFGAPTERNDHAKQAVLAAVAMVRRICALEDQWADLDFPDLKIGVGIHTGQVVAGMVGSPKRLDYTAIGDTTNTASRIEAQTKEFDVAILISAETYRALPSKERAAMGCAAEGKLVLLKGKPQPMMLHIVSVIDEPIKGADTSR